jgi:uncharacterized protein YfdQ (DUF2303 family)
MLRVIGYEEGRWMELAQYDFKGRLSLFKPSESDRVVLISTLQHTEICVWNAAQSF